MKKILSVLIAVTLFIGIVSSTAFAEPEIKGLDENLNELLMINYFTEEELTEMENAYMEFYSEFAINKIIPGRQEMRKMITGNVEDEYKLIMEDAKIDIDKGLRISHFSNGKYSAQYAQTGCFEYLFTDIEYWRVPLIRNGNGDSRTCYQINGGRFDDGSKYSWIHNTGLIEQNKVLKLVEEKNTIKKLLVEKGEREVEEIKICALALSRTGLYIKCPEQEYFLKTSDIYLDKSTNGSDNYYKFMTMAEATQEYEEHNYNTSTSYVTPVKNTFDTEAEALQAEGLLQGTEKGLELLKPLTRAEAATILLRAMGQSTENENAEIQTFSDVTPDYWGYGAVENSYKLGIMNGIGDNLFAPEENVTSAQFSTMVLRASGTYDFNWETALNLLIEKSIISQEDSKTMDFFTRGDMAKIIYEAKAKGLF